MGGELDLANAMAISGAAVSPTLMQNWLLIAVLLMANLRLGQWLVNPARLPRHFRVWEWLFSNPAAPLPVAMEHWCCKPRERNYCFVTDGGHHENLGIEALLERRCRVIIAMDGGNDPESGFYDFLRMLRRNAADCGIRLIGLEPDDQPHLLNRLCSTPPANFCQAHFVIIRIKYPDSPSLGPSGSVEDGYLIYVKSSLTGDEGLSLLKYREENAAFPHDTTLDQFYDAQRFEAYRQLGLHIGVKLCSELDAETADKKRAWLADWNPRQRGSAAPLPASDVSESMSFVDTAAAALVNRNSEVALVSTDSAPSQPQGAETMDGTWERPKKGK